jgi:hypothetical protein
MNFGKASYLHHVGWKKRKEYSVHIFSLNRLCTNRPGLDSQPHKTSSLPPSAPNKQPAQNTGSNRQPTHNRHPDQSLPLHLLVDQLPQTLRLQIPRLQIQQQVVIPPRLGVVAQLVVAQREIVQTLASAVGAGAEDLGEELYAVLLLRAGGGFD